MRSVFCSAWLLLCLSLPAQAGDFEAAETFRNRGDHARALPLYLKAAAQGHPLASHWAGFYYLEGIGTDQNVVKAAGFFLEGAHGGVENSMVYLAKLYLRGDGVPKDCERARYWITRATRGRLPLGWKIDLNACL